MYTCMISLVCLFLIRAMRGISLGMRSGPGARIDTQYLARMRWGKGNHIR